MRHFIVFLFTWFIYTSSAFAGCTGNATFSLSSSSICQNSSVTATNNTTATAKIFYWNWGDGGGFYSVANKNSQTHKYIVSGTYKVILVCSDSTCNDTTSLSITVNPLPTIVLGSDTSICINSGSVALKGSPSGGTWFASVSGISGSSFNPSSLTAGNVYSLGYTVTSSSTGCKDTQYRKFTILPKPIPNFSFTPDSACSKSTLNFNNNSSGGSSYSWKFDDGFTSSSANISHSFDTIGGGYAVFKVKLIAVSSGGCKDSISKNVHVKRRPKPLLTDTCNSVSSGSSAPFQKCWQSAQSSYDFLICAKNISKYKDSIKSYTIDWGDGIKYAYTSSFLADTHTYSKLGIFNIRIVAVGNNGCKDSTDYLAINATQPAVGISSNGSNTGCAPLGKYFKLTATTVSPGTTFTWDFGDGTTPIVWDYTRSHDSIYHVFTHSSCNSTNNYCNKCFYARVTANNGICDPIGGLIYPVTVRKRTLSVFSISSGPYCAGGSNSVKFTNQSVGDSCCSNSGYKWDFGDPGSGSSNTSTTTSPTHIFSKSGTFKIRLIAITGCC